MFDSKGRQIPCIGLSIGVERILNIVEARTKKGNKLRTVDTQVFVASVTKNMAEERLRILSNLWSRGIRAEHSYKNGPKLLQQLQYCEDMQIPLVIIIGEDEIKAGIVKLRNTLTRAEIKLNRDELIDKLKEAIESPEKFFS